MDQLKAIAKSVQLGRSLVDYLYEGTQKRLYIRDYTPPLSSPITIRMAQQLQSLETVLGTDDIPIGYVLFIGIGTLTKPLKTAYVLVKI